MVNRITLLGNTGKDVEVVTFDNGNKIAKVSLATTEYWKDKQSGEKKSHTEWHNLIFNGKMVDTAEKFVKKGDKLYVEGKISYRNYEKDGVKTYFTEISVREMKFLGSKPTNSADQNHEQRPKPSDFNNSDKGDSEGLPF